MRLPNFEADAWAAFSDVAEERIENEFLPELERAIRERLEAYGDRHEYDVSLLLSSMRTETRRTQRGVEAVVRLPHPALLFERGTVDHEIHARNADVLSFVWERRHNPPQWVRDEYEEEGDGWRVFLPSVEVSGLPEGRFIRDALHEIRRLLP